MYLPADDMDARKRVTDAFLSYRDLCKAKLWDRCVGVSHHSRVAHCSEQLRIFLRLYFGLVDSGVALVIPVPKSLGTLPCVFLLPRQLLIASCLRHVSASEGVKVLGKHWVRSFPGGL